MSEPGAGLDRQCDGLTWRFRVRVTPKAKKASVGGLHDGALKVSVHMVPEDGKANKAVIASLAKWLRVSKGRVAIVAGETSRLKTIVVEFKSQDEMNAADAKLRNELL
ncbi:DUF167 domain-containing protein [Rhodopirellula baltica]|uniref:DUF167 domain-containing protein n=1 Tax=Rhodopirellula baltica TaxID=265606 RepID=UPI00190FB72A|nr:DUF167 domain-containing protein [Rhodopirellula baltica]